MARIARDVHSVRLLRTDDPDYRAYMRRMADLRPARGGPRSAGEMLGGLVERCVRHWLQSSVPLQPERILAWDQKMPNGRNGTLYRELDGVWRIDDVSLCLFEMTLSTPEQMERGRGIKQLNIATSTLFASGAYEYVLKRLVYVAAEPVVVLDGLPELEPTDEYAELGVIWAPPDAVVRAAVELEIALPENWLEIEAREGVVEDPERDEWRQFASTQPQDAELGESDANPLAEALRRALEGGQ